MCCITPLQLVRHHCGQKADKRWAQKLGGGGGGGGGLRREGDGTQMLSCDAIRHQDRHNNKIVGDLSCYGIAGAFDTQSVGLRSSQIPVLYFDDKCTAHQSPFIACNVPSSKPIPNRTAWWRCADLSASKSSQICDVCLQPFVTDAHMCRHDSTSAPPV